jgi:hypothetical protein
MTAERPLFAFELRDIAEIEPWGEPDELSLSWFGLTRGWYWMNVGEDRLFVATRRRGSRPEVEYPVARLWEDVIGVLPAALEPHAHPPHGEPAARCRLDTGYLAAGPNIWFCRVRDRVRIIWDNRDLLDRGHPVWTATRGHFDVGVDDFVGEVVSFHDRLMDAMAARVRAVHTSWPRPEVHIDLVMLDAEQRERRTALAAALQQRAVG